MTNAILIDPFSETVSEVNLNLQSYEEIYGLLKCEMVDYMSFGDGGDKLLADDDGLFVAADSQAFFTFATEIQGRIIIAGRCLVVSEPKPEEWESPLSTLSDIQARTSWLEHSKGAAYAAQFC
jgi:hypothetical protein